MASATDVRAIARDLPGAYERQTWGEATFRVREKIFAMLSPDERRASIKAYPEEQDMLVRSNPNTFSVAPYTGRFGWVTVQLESVDHELLRQLIILAWRRTAPQRLAAAYDPG
jgi:hypothetical protein